MNNEILVSIVVITYNSEKFILETLDSIKNQTYKKIELIISDDASTDNTVDICTSWLNDKKELFENTKILTTSKNTGISGNVNRGIKASSGEWFKLIAGDDLLLPQCIEYNMNYIENSPYSISILNTAKIRFHNKEEQTYQATHATIDKKIKRSIFFSESVKAEEQLQLALRNTKPAINGQLIKRELFDTIGGCDEKFPMLEDRPLMIKILLSNTKIYGDGTPTVLYRVHSDSIFNKNKNKFLYTKWYVESYIPVIEAYYYPYLTKIEVFIYKLLFSYVLFSYNTFLNRNLLPMRVLDRIINYPINLCRNYYKRKTEKKIQRRLNSLKKNVNPVAQ